MKKLFLIPVLALIFTSCEDVVKHDYDNGQTAYLFSKVTSNLTVNNTSITTIEIPVGVTTRTDVDRTVPIVIDPTSTATPAMYTIDPTSLVIPAGQFSTMVKITGNFSAIPAVGGAILKLKFSEFALSGKDMHTVTIARFCPTSLAGNYSVTTTYGFHDFLPNYATNTMTTAITSAGVNKYKVADFSGGLYSTGPYASAYGTGSAGQAANRDLTFDVNCGDVTWTGESDPWGAIILQSASPLSNPGPNTYNAANGKITISWYCVGYGEHGVSVYTPTN